MKDFKLSLTAKTTMAIAVTGAVLIHIGSISCQQCSLQLNTSHLVSETQEIIGELDATTASLTDLENNEHLYVITGDNNFKSQFETVVQALSRHISVLQTLMKKSQDDPHGRELQQLAGEVKERVEKGQRLIGRRNAPDFKLSEAAEIGSTSTLSQQIRGSVLVLKAFEQNALTANNNELQLASVNNIFGINILMIVVFSMLLIILLFVVRYVEERTKAENSLRTAERRFKAVFNQTFQFTNLLSKEGYLLESSHNVLDFAGLNQQQVVDKPFWEMPWWPKNQDTQERLKHAIKEAASGNFVRFEEVQVGRDGQAMTVDVSVKPVKDEDGKIVMLIPEARDISERKTTEHALAEREARMRAVVDTAPDVILTVAPGGKIESANPATFRIFGYLPDELRGKSVDLIIGHFFADPDSPVLHQGLRLGESEIVSRGRELAGYRKDGSTIPVELAVSLTNLGDRQIYTAIIRDITERKEAERRVSDFYATVSHELRTPLTSIRTALGLMESGSMGKGSSKTGQLLRIARSECDRLIRLINDILDIRKIEAGKAGLKLQEIEPETLIQITFDALRSLAKEADVNLESEIVDPSKIFCDQDRIVQVLNNLVSNAIRFAPKGSAVLVRVLRTAETGACRFCVIDKGPGIPVDQVHKLFDKFAQIDHGASQEKGGTGLGLAITKAIVSQHAGKIGVESEPGQGSNFWFELPDRALVEAPLEGVALSAAKRVLVVDDNEDVVDLLNGLLSSGGYEMMRAATVSEGNRLLHERRPDVVLLDVQLPDGNGLDFVNKMVLGQGEDALPVVILPGRDQTQHTLGNPVLIDWLIKPNDDERLRHALELALQNELSASKVLLVMPDAERYQRLSSKLKQFKIECLKPAQNGGIAEQVLSAENPPDLIILDIDVPEEPCLEIFQILRQESIQSIPLLVYTDKDLDKEDLDKLTLAFSRYLSKTHMTESEFLSALRQLLDSRLRTPERSQPLATF